MKFGVIFKNATWIVMSRIVQSMLGLFISMITVRYLGPSNYGIINYASSIVAFVVPIMQLGLRNILVHEYIQSPQKEGKILGTTLLMNVVSSFLCIIGVIAFVSVVNKGEQDTIIVCSLYSISIVFQAVEMVQYWFQAKLLSKYTSIVSVIAYIVMSLYRIYLLTTGKSVYWFAISQAIDYAIISIVLLLIYKRIGKDKISISIPEGKRMLTTSKYYIVPNMMVTIFAQMDSIMLKLMVNEKAVGCYAAALTCAGITGFVFTAIIDSFRPVILKYKDDENYMYEKMMKQLYSLIIYMSLLQCIVITIFANKVIGILYGEAYKQSVFTLQIIVWHTTFSYIGAVRNIWILAEKKQQHLWKINLVGVMANLVLNFLLIPQFGIIGAALASLITQILTNVVVGYLIKPIRDNNRLMLYSLNPKYLRELLSNFNTRTWLGGL